MNTDQFVRYGLIIAAIFGLMGVALESTGSADGFYTIAGLLLYIFGIWAAIKLLTKKPSA